MTEQLFTLRITLYDGRDLLFYNHTSATVNNAKTVVWSQGIKRPHNNLVFELISPRRIKEVWVEMQKEKLPINYEELEAGQTKPLTTKQQYDMLCEINPLVEELKERLKLQLGY
jgi:hypothetical protein